MDKPTTRTYHYTDYYLSDLAVVAVYSWTGPHRNPWCESAPVSMVLRCIQMREAAAAS